MDELSSSELQEIWREAVEFAKFLRRIVIITIVTIFILLMPIHLTYGEPISFYLVKLAIRNPFIEVPGNIVLIMGEPAGPIRVILSSALLFGVLISSPISLILFYRYLRPALYPHERKIAIKVTLATGGLFYAGLTYGFLIIAPLTVKIMIAFSSVASVEPFINVADFYDFIIISTLATAIGFLIPLFVFIANRVFNIDLSLRKHWRYILILGYAVTAVLTPDPTPITALLIIGPPLTLSVIAEVVALRKKST
ncbi:MAG: twin-arginine translocase subunit TatC [Desulfurococcaceae archaeon]